MKRFKYGLNSQIFTTSNFKILVATSIVEASPGDTISGSITNRIISESATKPIMNRTYLDQFTFYVPYRLVWADWPDFIAGTNAGPVPTTTAVTAVYSTALIKNGSTGTYNEFAVRAYNLIWNKFFRDQSLPELPLTNYGVQNAPLRTTTFNQRLKDAMQLVDETIDTSGPTVTTGDIRSAFSQDRFNKTRAYYGDKYTDYLAALGVEASWSILDEPELIGKQSQPLKLVMTDATTEIDSVDPDSTNPTYVGSMGAKWQGTNQQQVRRTFTPEHGLIITLATIRMDVEHAGSRGVATNLKTVRDQWYSPEFETERKQEWFPYTAAAGGVANSMFLEKYDDLRVGQNITDRTDNRNGTWIDTPALDTYTQGDIRYPVIPAGDFLNDQFTNIQFNHNITQRLTRVSPVRPAQSVHGVS